MVDILLRKPRRRINPVRFCAGDCLSVERNEPLVFSSTISWASTTSRPIALLVVGHRRHSSPLPLRPPLHSGLFGGKRVRPIERDLAIPLLNQRARNAPHLDVDRIAPVVLPLRTFESGGTWNIPLFSIH